MWAPAPGRSLVEVASASVASGTTTLLTLRARDAADKEMQLKAFQETLQMQFETQQKQMQQLTEKATDTLAVAKEVIAHFDNQQFFIHQTGPLDRSVDTDQMIDGFDQDIS